MESFEELGVAPELIEALAAEGVERPTRLQEEALPVVRRGNNLVLAAGPGSGLLVAWAVPLLERIRPDVESPRILVLTATSETADRLAESVARLSAMTGHSVAALDSAWLLPERAGVLLGTPDEVVARLRAGELTLTEVEALVVDQAQLFEQLTELENIERVIDYLPSEAQRIVSSLPVTEAVQDLVQRHCRRAVTVPASDGSSAPKRGRVRYRVTSEPREAAALELAGEVLDAGVRHVLVFCRSEDRAADLGDYLTLHGFRAGAPGDEAFPVWLGVDALPARSEAEGVDGVMTVSCDVPPDADALDRRHGFGREGFVLVLPRELAHLKCAGRAAGYEVVPSPPPTRTPKAVEKLRRELERAIADGSSAGYVAILEPLFERHDPAEVAAAALALLREGDRPETERTAPPVTDRAEPAAAPAWAKLFISVGQRDELRPGDLLGAITGEAGVDGGAVGKIDIRENHSVVEVHDTAARRVINALNGTTIRGRAVRADFDRPRQRSSRRAPSR